MTIVEDEQAYETFRNHIGHTLIVRNNFLYCTDCERSILENYIHSPDLEEHKHEDLESDYKTLEMVNYGTQGTPPENVALECNVCNVVIEDVERPQ